MRSDVICHLMAALAALMLTSCYDGNPSDFRESVVVGREEVTALAVTAPATVLETGETLKLAAVATTAGGTVDLSSKVTWHSSNPAALSIDDRGQVTARADGTATVTAAIGVYNASVELTASSARLVAISVAGDILVDECDVASYSASGTYEDGTQRDITQQVEWTSDSLAVARMSTLEGERNLLVSRNAGTVSVMATRDGVSSPGFVVTVADTLDALDAEPDSSPLLDYGATRQFTATGSWGERQADISRAADWSVTNADVTAPAVAVVTSGDVAPGLLTARAGGDATLTATCGGQSDVVEVSVVSLQSLAITNARPIELDTGESLLLSLEGTYSSGTQKPLNEVAIWSVTTVDGTGVTVSTTAGSRGRVTAGSAAGVSTVTARVEGREVSVSVTVVE